MPFKKGMNRTGGRSKGTSNKLTTELRSMMSDFMFDEWESIKDDFKQLEPKERLIIYEKLLQYCLPKCSSNSQSSNDDKIEQPLFETVISYELDLNKIEYPELKEMIEKSKVFMSNKQSSIVRFELPDNHRLNKIDENN